MSYMRLSPWHDITSCMYLQYLKKTADSVFSYFHSVLKGRKVYYFCSIAVIAFIYSFFVVVENNRVSQTAG